MTTPTLNDLNTLRTAAGMKPLKAWKESKAKLADAIAKLAAKATPAETTTETVVEVNTEVNGNQPILEDDDMAKAKKTKKVSAKKATKTADKKDAPEGVSISTIAEELGIDAKVARAKLRRQENVPSIEGERWLFKKTDVAAIKKLLQSDARKKA